MWHLRRTLAVYVEVLFAAEENGFHTGGHRKIMSPKRDAVHLRAAGVSGSTLDNGV
jgi:hypothetical protein